MGFWKYCEKVRGFMCGDEVVIRHIHVVRKFWDENKTVGECAGYVGALDLCYPRHDGTMATPQEIADGISNLFK